MVKVFSWVRQRMGLLQPHVELAEKVLQPATCVGALAADIGQGERPGRGCRGQARCALI